MASSSEKSEPGSDCVGAYPLIYLEADWGQDLIDCFNFGVRLVKADKQALDAMREQVREQCPKFPGEYVFENDVQWLLVVPAPQMADHVPAAEVGMSFRERVEQVVVDSFLLCLRLTRQTAAICPVSFRGRLQNSSLTIDTSREDYSEPDYSRPSVEYCERFRDEDLTKLAALWQAVVELRQLPQWVDRVFDEPFFANLDRKAGESAPEVLGRHLPVEVDRSILDEYLGKNPDAARPFYREAFRKAFAEAEENALSVRTRLGRAMKLYDEGLHLPPLHAFLSMCLVLETLFTVDHGELTHKITTRFAKMVSGTTTGASPEEKRRDLFKRAKLLYGQRGEVVHGSKLIDRVPQNVRKDAFELCRLALRHILYSDSLHAAYADPSTADKSHKKKGEDIRGLRGLFRDLDLDL
jgi:hypothetical protein